MTAARSAEFPPPTALPAIRATGLSFTFAGRREPALVDLSFELPSGSWTLLAGPTGSGKSTLLRALAGLIPHHSPGTMQGRVELWGQPTTQLASRQLAERVGLVLQSPDDQLCSTTPAAEVAFGLENLNLPTDEIARRVDTALAEVGLGGLAEAPVHRLSGGQKQRLVLTSILAMRPKILLLDEPLSQLDPAAAADFLTSVEQQRAQGLTVVVAEHRWHELLPRCDRLLLLDQGRLLDQGPRDPLTRWQAAIDRFDLAWPEATQLSLNLGWEPLASIEALVAHAAARGYLVAGGRTELAPVSTTAETVSVQVSHTAGGATGTSLSPTPTTTSSKSSSTLSGPLLLQATGLGFTYPGQPQPLWREINLSFTGGECVALLGANGSGKSTLLSVLSGLYRPTAGTLTSGNDAVAAADAADELRHSGRQHRSNRAAWRAGLVLQNPDLMLFCATVRDELAFGPRQDGLSAEQVADRVERAARQFDLAPQLDQPPQGLSQGQRLRLAVAAAWTLNWPLLLLDEPTTGQDQRQVERLMQTLTDAVAPAQQPARPDQASAGNLPGSAASSRALLFSTHDLRLVDQYANRAIVLCEGRLAFDGCPAELFQNDHLLARAALRRPPVWEIRRRLQLRAVTLDGLAVELRR